MVNHRGWFEPSQQQESGQAQAGSGSLTDAPIDRAHLDRQTLNDPVLRAEVLQLFQDQATSVGARIANADQHERRALAHGLRGSASGIGAFQLADWAARVEHSPADLGAVEGLKIQIDSVVAHIAGMRG